RSTAFTVSPRPGITPTYRFSLPASAFGTSIMAKLGALSIPSSSTPYWTFSFPDSVRSHLSRNGSSPDAGVVAMSASTDARPAGMLGELGPLSSWQREDCDVLPSGSVAIATTDPILILSRRPSWRRHSPLWPGTKRAGHLLS